MLTKVKLFTLFQIIKSISTKEMPVPGERLAGHPPATIVGGKRVATHHSSNHNEAPPTANDKDKKSSGSDKEDSVKDDSLNDEKLLERRTSSGNMIMVNGSPMKIEEAFPTEAMRRMQDKPLVPKHELLNVHNHNEHARKNFIHIQQPRK